ncbi:MAG TPA: EutN/CcmL family microcompartment protein [Negativicutes bacterium]|nr:EutN/CcmL family microcompartment protein [Negativicutes bacterium]
MWIGKIVGTLVATPKDETLVGKKLLFVQPMKFQQNQSRIPVVAVDTIGAGTGEIVLVVAGSSARFLMGSSNAAVDAAIIGIVDNIELKKELLEE